MLGVEVPLIVQTILLGGALATAAGALFKWVLHPFIRGLRRTWRGIQDITGLYEIAQKQLAPNNGESLIDKVDQIHEQVKRDVMNANMLHEHLDGKIDKNSKRIDKIEETVYNNN